MKIGSMNPVAALAAALAGRTGSGVPSANLQGRNRGCLLRRHRIPSRPGRCLPRIGRNGAQFLLVFLATGAFLSLADSALAIDMPSRGSYTYFSADQCARAGKFAASICRNAQINARAEFEEKAPAFVSRKTCETKYGRGRCSIVSAAAGVCPGAGRGLCFMPRQRGFRISVRYGGKAFVVPLGPRGPIAFSRRSALRPMASRSRKVRARVRQAMQPVRGSRPWVAAPRQGPQPAVARRAIDRNFNCSLVVEIRPGEDPNSFCYPARRR